MARSPSQHADLARAVARVSTDYMLRVLRLLTEIQQGDVVNAIICQAILSANTAHLVGAPVGDGDGQVPSDEQRKPISVLAVANSLGLPFETTRRHVNGLIKAGACQRVRGGVIVPASALADPRFLEAAETNLAYVQHMIRGLKRVGLDVE